MYHEHLPIMPIGSRWYYISEVEHTNKTNKYRVMFEILAYEKRSNYSQYKYLDLSNNETHSFSETSFIHTTAVPATKLGKMLYL